MPVIARLRHCVILMYFRDHNPPHFHVDTPEAQAQLSIRTLRVIRGGVHRRALREAQEWAMANRERLWSKWEEFNP